MAVDHVFELDDIGMAVKDHEIECSSDAVAVDVARSLIAKGRRAEVWMLGWRVAQVSGQGAAPGSESGRTEEEVEWLPDPLQTPR